jgi:uncharacterized protein YndB with AHSA1/START domain
MTVDEGGQGGRIDRSLTVAAPVDVVWRAIATSDGLEAWLGGGVELDARPGRPVLVRWPDGSSSRGLVERVEPDRRIVFRWRRIAGAGLSLRASDPTRVEISLAPLGDGTTRIDVVETSAPMPAPPVAVAPPPAAGRGAA